MKNADFADLGIITFHCADNYGAMLQAYGLKYYLRGKGVAADIVRYEPPFMTGRHWLFPYLPTGSGRRRLWRALTWGIGNLRMGRAYFIRKANMKRFRETYLVKKKQRRCLFSNPLKRLPYSCYIVGSDQIWNPDITCGLRPVYFGVFDNKNKQKVVAYGASIGGISLAPQYDKEFSALIQNLDAVSVREEEALPYIERFYRGPVTAVLDPVFLLKREQWQKIERKPKRDGYILFYAVEQNEEMTDFAKRLAERTGLFVIELQSSGGSADRVFETDRTAGPAEFLGYIHKADYVVTNSLHATAFGIIYRKKFIVFLHKSRGARISNILKLHGLEDRLYQEGRKPRFSIDWEEVEKQTARHVRAAEQFLLEQTVRQTAVPRNGE